MLLLRTFGVVSMRAALWTRCRRSIRPNHEASDQRQPLLM